MNAIQPRTITAGSAFFWAAASVVSALQIGLTRAASGAPLDLAEAWARHVPILALWAAATPLILRAARRFPCVSSGKITTRNLLIHAAAALLTVALTNLGAAAFDVLRLGLDPWPLVVTAAARGFAAYVHMAVIVYAMIAVAGHLLPAGEPTDPAPSAESRDLAVQRANDRLAVKVGYRIHLLPFDEIDWFEADDDRVVVHAGGRTYPLRERLKRLEERLDATRFTRIHRSYLVNLQSVSEVQPYFHGDYIVVMKDGAKLRMSRSRREDFETALGQPI